jgi:imidazolonepropionase-like amidohydrolase
MTKPISPLRQRMIDGLTPIQAITNATSDAAALLKLDDRGVLASGKLADLVVLEGDPIADISNSRMIHAVWHRGKKAAGAFPSPFPEKMAHSRLQKKC